MNKMYASAVPSRETVLDVRHVDVSFPIYHGGSRSLKKSLLFKGSAGRLAHDGNHRITVQALRDISLSLATGDRLALIGPNGAGKTTLLRVMAGIYEPTGGDAIIRGRISPMFDIGLGIDTDLSGYDNIRIRAMILGLTNSEIEGRMADIAEFTELGDYLDMPMRTYSSGMILRLTFAVATCFEPEILLMDEWIVAGDESFMVKAEKRLISFVDRASVLVLASHNIEVCHRWCNKGLWMDQGRIKAFGDIDDIIEKYRASI
jgi:ABC-type polysaccharide/polyol phosphate transport system ATPase subunit